MRPLSTAVGLRAAARTPLRSSVRTLGRRLNSTASEAAGTSGAGPEKPKSAYERFKELTKTYGSYAVIMYLALSAVDFTLSFAVVHAVGADRIEPAVDAITRWYRGIRHGKEGAEALEKADAAKKLADDAEEAADAVLRKNKTEAWYTSKTLWAEITLAYAIHKVGLLPLRAGLTVAWTPKVVNFLRARGWIGTVSGSGSVGAWPVSKTR